MNAVAGLIALLRAHPVSGDPERLAVRAALQFAEATPDPFDRHAGSTHITASGIIAGARGTVLHVHKRSGKWLQPGGHIDTGETPAAAALREALEETGLVCRHPFGGPRLLQVDRHVTVDGHTHLDLLYLVIGDDVEPIPGEDESPAVRWFSWKEARSVADECLRSALCRAEAASR